MFLKNVFFEKGRAARQGGGGLCFPHEHDFCGQAPFAGRRPPLGVIVLHDVQFREAVVFVRPAAAWRPRAPSPHRPTRPAARPAGRKKTTKEGKLVFGHRTPSEPRRERAHDGFDQVLLLWQGVVVHRTYLLKCKPPSHLRILLCLAEPGALLGLSGIHEPRADGDIPLPYSPPTSLFPTPHRKRHGFESDQPFPMGTQGATCCRSASGRSTAAFPSCRWPCTFPRCFCNPRRHWPPASAGPPERNARQRAGQSRAEQRAAMERTRALQQHAATQRTRAAPLRQLRQQRLEALQGHRHLRAARLRRVWVGLEFREAVVALRLAPTQHNPKGPRALWPKLLG